MERERKNAKKEEWRGREYNIISGEGSGEGTRKRDRE